VPAPHERKQLHESESNQWCRRRGCKRTPKSFDLVKIPENPGKLCKNLGKFLKTLPKSLQKWRPTWFDLKKRRPTLAESHEDLFLEVISKMWTQVFGQLWGNTGKNPSHPQNLACSYTYEYNSHESEMVKTTNSILTKRQVGC